MFGELTHTMQSKKFEPSDSPDLTPSQIAAWYRAVGGNYDPLFIETAPSSIAFIYRAIGAFHSLQPSASDDGFSSPATPALTRQGFVTWQTIQILLGPQEHVLFLQKSVEQFDVIDPDTGQPFLKILPSKCFPDKPDEAMEEWYQGVADRLRRETDTEANKMRAKYRHQSSVDLSGGGSLADQRRSAFKYFEDPTYRKARPRPTYMRHMSTESARASNDVPLERARHTNNPWARQRSLPPGACEDNTLSDEGATSIAHHPPTTQQYRTYKHPQPPQWVSSQSTTDSNSASDQPSLRRGIAVPLHRRSYEQIRPSPQLPSNARPDTKASGAPSPAPMHGRTESPLFTTTPSQQTQKQSHHHPPALTARSSYRSVLVPNVRYASHSTSVSPQHVSLPHVYDRHQHVIRGAEAYLLDGSIYRDRTQNRDHRIQDSNRLEERSEGNRGPAKISYRDADEYERVQREKDQRQEMAGDHVREGDPTIDKEGNRSDHGQSYE